MPDSLREDRDDYKGFEEILLAEVGCLPKKVFMVLEKSSLWVEEEKSKTELICLFYEKKQMKKAVLELD